MWDLMNSAKTEQSGQKAPILSQNLESSRQKFDELAACVEEWQFRDRNGVVRRCLPVKEGLVNALKGMRDLVTYLIQEGFFYVRTRRFDQDGIENLFCQIRFGRGSLNGHPEPCHAICNLRITSLTMCLSLPRGTNCTDDGDNFLVPLPSSKQKNPRLRPEVSDTQRVGRPQRQAKSMGVTALWSGEDLPDLSEVEGDILEYISGYLAKKGVRRNVCRDCSSLLRSNVESSNCLLRKKSYTEVNPLVVPSTEFKSSVETMEKNFRKYIGSTFHKKNIKQFFVRRMRNCLMFLPPCRCASRDFIASLFVRTRLHFYCKQECLGLKDQSRMVQMKRTRLGR